MKKILMVMVVMVGFCGVGRGQTRAYIINEGDSSVSVINTATNTITATIRVGNNPEGVSVSPNGRRVYVTNYTDNTVSVINAFTNTVIATIPVGSCPYGIAVSPDGGKVYVANYNANSISVINTVTNMVSSTIHVWTGPISLVLSPNGNTLYVTENGNIHIINTLNNSVVAVISVLDPSGICISPDGSRLYVANFSDNTVSVINTTTYIAIDTIPVGPVPFGICVTSDGSKVYVANLSGYSVSVINTTTNTVSHTIGVGTNPEGVSITSDGTKVYVPNSNDNTVSVINTAANYVTATIPVGVQPGSFGNFIGTFTPCTAISPIITPSGSTTFCQGDSVTLTSSQAPFYLWSTTATTQSITVHASGNYSVTITDSNGCTASSSPMLVVVHDLPTPIITVTGSLALCQGDSVVLTASQDSLYLWSTGSSSQSITVNSTGSYLVTVTDSNGCRGASAATGVIVYPMPHAAFTTNDTLGCTDYTVHFTNTSTNATNYHWLFGDSQQNFTPSPNHTYTNQGSYSITLIAINDTSVCPNDTVVKINLIEVNQSPTPTVLANGALSFCHGDSVLLTADAWVSYLWNTGASTQSIEADTSGNYFVTVTSSNGCTGASSGITVYVYPLPTPSITASGPLSFCIGDSVTLNCSVDSLYSWNTGATTQSITTDTSGIYTVTITLNTGCTGTASVTVAVHLYPTDSIVSSATIPICFGVDDTLTCIPAGASYHWNNNATTQSIIVNDIGNYVVTMIDANGCTATSSTIIITTNPLPVPNIASLNAISFCPGGSDTLMCIPSGASYLWNNGATTQRIVVDSTGVFFVSLTDGNGCFGNSPFENITEHTAPAPHITVIGDTLSIPNFVTMQWLANGTPISGATFHQFTDTANGCYSVLVTDNHGCTGISDTICFSTGINNIMMNDEISIFPNPTNGSFTIALGSRNDAAEIRITDVVGQVIVQTIVTTTINIDFSNKPAGVYFIQLVIGDKTYNRKMVVGRF